jgi:hypothetical protein
VTKVKGQGFNSVYTTTIHLNEGDILVFEEKGRGYIKPVEQFVTVEEGIEELPASRKLVSKCLLKTKTIPSTQPEAMLSIGMLRKW